MCGIIGIIDKQNSVKSKLLDSLQKLEYRGYDSAGIAILDENAKLHIRKTLKSVDTLKHDISGNDDINGTIGIGHTRWATHGIASLKNAHPIIFGNQNFQQTVTTINNQDLNNNPIEYHKIIESLHSSITVVIIHNGIIENYDTIKSKLCGPNNLETNFHTNTETDTEIIAASIYCNLMQILTYKSKFMAQSVAQSMQQKSVIQELTMIEQQQFKQYAILDTINLDAKLDITLLSTDDYLSAVRSTSLELRGEFAFIVIFEITSKFGATYKFNFETTNNVKAQFIIGVSNGLDLTVGIEDDCKYISSDTLAISDYAKEVVYLSSGNMCLLTVDHVLITDFYGYPVIKNTSFISSSNKLEKNGYENFMLKEIYEQQILLPRLTDQYLSDIKNSEIDFSYIESFDSFHIIGCGSSLYSATIAKYWIESYSNKCVSVEIASEFCNRNINFNKKCLYIFISQSGETVDTLKSLKKALNAKVQTLAIVNVLESQITRLAHYIVPINAGTEIAVASTKSFTCQLLAFTKLFACIFTKSQLVGTSNSNNANINSLNHDIIINHVIHNNMNNTDNNTDDIDNNDNKCGNNNQFTLKTISKIVAKTILTSVYNEITTNVVAVFALEYQIKLIAKQILKRKYKNFLFIGRGQSYILAMEGALKLKELAYIPCEGIAAGELKHGSMALIDHDTIIVVIAPQNALFSKMKSNIREIQARGANVLVLTSIKSKNEIQKLLLETSFIVPNITNINIKNVDTDITPQVHSSSTITIMKEVLALPDIENDIVESILYTIPLQVLAYYISVYSGHNVDRPRNLAKSVTVE